MSSGVRSAPTTVAPSLAAVSPTTPVPQATSSTLSVESIPANFISLGAAVPVMCSSGAKFAQTFL